jgi:hypothetical protein
MIQHHKPLYNAAMLDIETMGTGPSAAVVQIALVGFNFETFEVQAATDVFDADVDLTSALMLGGVTDEPCVRWWRDRGGFRPKGPARDLRSVLVLLRRWFDDRPSIERVWAQGPSFDIAVLEGYFRRAGMDCPWKYNAPRDTRTAYDLAADTGLWSKSGREPDHDALSDCRLQIDELRGAMAVLRDLVPRSTFQVPEPSTGVVLDGSTFR